MVQLMLYLVVAVCGCDSGKKIKTPLPAWAPKHMRCTSLLLESTTAVSLSGSSTHVLAAECLPGVMTKTVRTESALVEHLCLID